MIFKIKKTISIEKRRTIVFRVIMINRTKSFDKVHHFRTFFTDLFSLFNCRVILCMITCKKQNRGNILEENLVYELRGYFVVKMRNRCS